MNHFRRDLRPLRALRVCVVGAFILALASPAFAQRGGAAGRGGGAPATPQASAALDLTGYWVSVISEDWKYRMVTPKAGVFDSLPLNGDGRKIGMAWDPSKDEAAGEACRAYTAANVMRLPGRIHVTWRDANTLQIETDAGTQTRLLRFGNTTAPAPPRCAYAGVAITTRMTAPT